MSWKKFILFILITLSIISTTILYFMLKDQYQLTRYKGQPSFKFEKTQTKDGQIMEVSFMFENPWVRFFNKKWFNDSQITVIVLGLNAFATDKKGNLTDKDTIYDEYILLYQGEFKNKVSGVLSYDLCKDLPKSCKTLKSDGDVYEIPVHFRTIVYNKKENNYLILEKEGYPLLFLRHSKSKKGSYNYKIKNKFPPK